MVEAVKTPWHLWIVGGLGAVWNGLGCIDYTIAMRLANKAYVAQFVDEKQMAFFTTMPLWAEAAWALGVGGGLAGSLLLLARSRYAVPVFVLSLIGLALCTWYEYVLWGSLDIWTEGWKVGFVLLLWSVAISLPLYANRMRQKGLLR